MGTVVVFLLLTLNRHLLSRIRLTVKFHNRLVPCVGLLSMCGLLGNARRYRVNRLKLIYYPTVMLANLKKMKTC